MGHRLFPMLWRWARRRHRNKPNTWIRRKYFREDWAFYSQDAALLRYNQVPVTRFTKVTGKYSPMDPDQADYWSTRRPKRRECLTFREVDRLLHRLQEYRCGLCGLDFKERDPLHIHHIVPLPKGGSDDLENLMLVHKWCHTAYHARRTARA